MGGTAVSRSCFFAGWPDAGPCDGRLIRAHLVPRQVLKRELNAGPSVIDDPRTWVWCCGGPMGVSGHHGKFDSSRTLRIPRHRLPAGFVSFMDELGLGWWIDRTYPS